METLIALKILKLSQIAKYCLLGFSSVLFAVFKMKFQFIVEAWRGKEWKNKSKRKTKDHRCGQMCYTCCSRALQVGPGKLCVVGRRDLLLPCSKCSRVAPTVAAPGLCTLANLMCSL